MEKEVILSWKSLKNHSQISVRTLYNLHHITQICRVRMSNISLCDFC